MPKPPRVFVSSTYLDNARRRQLVEESIRAAGMVPVGMERFEADTLPPVEKCLEMLAPCDVLVGILAWRRGWEPPGHDGKSITEIEYDAARERLMFLLDGRLDPDAMDEGDDRLLKQHRLEQFKKRIAETPRRFEDDTLQMAVFESLKAWAKKRRKKTRTSATGSVALHAAAEPEIASFVERTAQSFREIVLAGFETRVRVPLRLEDLFVPMSLRFGAGTESNGAQLRGRPFELDGEDGDTERSGRIALTAAFQRANEAGRHGIAILGHPGSGKTTQLKRLHLWVATKTGEDLGLPADMLPLFVPLRHARGGERSIEDLLESWRESAGAERSAASVSGLRPPPAPSKPLARRLLERGKLLFLLDGLDEVADESARAAVARSIEHALENRTDCRFVVSCRFAGYTPSVALSQEFLELELAPLDFAQAQAFVRNWFRAVEGELMTDREAARAKAEREADELVERLRRPDMRTGRVVALTRNPLLLTAICLVHRDRSEGGREGLPTRRAELYDECVNVLLEHWRKSQNVAVSLRAEEARRVLQPLAYWMHSERDRVVASADAIAPVIEPLLKQIQWKGGSAAKFLERIRDESGLLTGWSDTSFGFLHLTFQEYLAAREIVRLQAKDGRRAAELAGKLGESWWREVSLLALALEESPMFEPFVRALLQRPEIAQHGPFLRACVLDAYEPSPEPFVELLTEPHRNDPELWERQLAALWALQEAAPERLAALADHLRRHPDPRISQHYARRSAQRVVRTERGECELAYIQGGMFRMGSSQAEIERCKRDWPDYANAFDREAPEHEVELASFYLGTHSVTNEQYGRFLAANPDAHEPERWGDPAWNDPNQPVVAVSWEDAQAFCRWAGCRLPSEAEWEYACRAGTRTRYWAGDGEADLRRVGWFAENSGGRVHVVAEKPANEHGLFDMHGNVWEWCEDRFGPYSPARQTNPTGPAAGAARVLRGGSAWYGADWCRSAYRLRFDPGLRDVNFGFRVALSAPRAVDPR